MNHGELLHLCAERTALQRMLDETPAEDVLDRGSLAARLRQVDAATEAAENAKPGPARVRLTFNGRPVVGSHGVFAEFGLKAVSGFTESVAAMAASMTGRLAAMGPLPNREQHQLLITRTALGSFGFELEEHLADQLTFDAATPVAQAIEQTQSLLRATQGTDDELADVASTIDRRALDKVRSFLSTLADNDATCSMQCGESVVSFTDVGQVRASLGRLSQDNLREERQTLTGELLGVLPHSRQFEFQVASTSQVIRGKLAPSISDPNALNEQLHRPVHLEVLATRVGSGKPRYVLVAPPLDPESGAL